MMGVVGTIREQAVLSICGIKLSICIDQALHLKSLNQFVSFAFQAKQALSNAEETLSQAQED